MCVDVERGHVRMSRILSFAAVSSDNALILGLVTTVPVTSSPNAVAGAATLGILTGVGIGGPTSPLSRPRVNLLGVHRPWSPPPRGRDRDAGTEHRGPARMRPIFGPLTLVARPHPNTDARHGTARRGGQE
jgi:hypothetical protein